MRRNNVGVVALVPDRWDAPWMPRHHVLSRLAGHFHVTWLEPVPHWRKAVGERRLLGAARVEADSGLVLYGMGLPSFHRLETLARAAFRSRVRGAARLLRRRGARHLVLYLWRPQFEPAIEVLDWDLVCYHVDDEYTFSGDDVPTPPRERRLLASADQVFVHSPGLLEKKGGINPHTDMIPNGVDYEAFAAPVAEPFDLASIPRPRIGYTGMLKRQVDWELLLLLAGGRPEWSFVFVGGRSPHPELDPLFREIESLSNVHLLGHKPVEELGRYPQHFDVCVMPYRMDGYTRYIYPMKLHEYLASGRPVVASPIRTLEDFGHVVRLASGPEAWTQSIEASLGPEATGERAREERQAVARAHDWDLLVERIAGRIEERLGDVKG